MKISSVNLFQTNSHNVSNFHGSAALTSSSIFSNNLIDDEKDRALRELDNKKASNGMTYAEARDNIYRIKKYYMGKKETCKTTTPADERFGIPEFYFGLDPEKLPEKDKEIFYHAKAAIEEIEHANPELAVRAGVVNYSDVMPLPAKPYFPPNNNNSQCDPGFSPSFIESKPDNSARLDWGKPLDRFTETFTDAF